LADVRWNIHMLRIHADLWHNRPDMHRLADLHGHGDVQQDADLRPDSDL
jgi:hypothetical protein